MIIRKFIIWPISLLLVFFLGWQAHNLVTKSQPLKETLRQVVPKPLEKYSIANLSQTKVPSYDIQVESLIKETPEFTSYDFTMTFDPTLSRASPKKVSGLINLPTQIGTPNPQQKFPVIVMYRGFVDQKIYKTGMGSQRAGEYFAKNGFITVAPDFLGYANSDTEAENIFESRFQTYTTGLAILASLQSIKQWDGKNIFIWGHSNGGQIALTILEITGKNYPTTLWAPVSKLFPYSILYYTDESEDRGKLIRKALANFEELYNPDQYSLDNYLPNITAPIQIHQGTSDSAVPFTWSNNLYKNLLKLNLEVKLHKYPGADHNLQPAWNQVISRDLEFFKSHLVK